MKQTRRRRHLRPRPTRSQVNQQMGRVRSTLQLFQLEWLVEASKSQPSLSRLRFLHDSILTMKDELEALEAC
jgi:hypothetical protein